MAIVGGEVVFHLAIVGGEVVFENGACTRVDEAEVMAEANAGTERPLSRLDLDLSILRRI